MEDEVEPRPAGRTYAVVEQMQEDVSTIKNVVILLVISVTIQVVLYAGFLLYLFSGPHP